MTTLKKLTTNKKYPIANNQQPKTTVRLSCIIQNEIIAAWRAYAHKRSVKSTAKGKLLDWGFYSTGNSQIAYFKQDRKRFNKGQKLH